MKIILRELSADDIPFINKWRNDYAVIELLGNNFNYISKEVDELWYRNYLANRSLCRRLAIVDTEIDEIVGTVQLTNIHSINRSAEYSIMIGNKLYWSRGVGFIASKYIVSHAFNDLNLHRIYLTVLEKNTRAIALYKKLGFVQEGLHEQALFKNGHYENLVSMALLSDKLNTE
jgi:diamine N-acetyltransferase